MTDLVQVSPRSTNLYAVSSRVDPHQRFFRNGHQGGVLWLTGLSGSGKSTLAVEAEWRLFRQGWQVLVLDGDNLRGGLNSDLGFAPADRAQNIRRAAEVAKLFAQSGFLVMTAFISPYREDRRIAAAINGPAFHEVYVAADLAACEGRDPKGLYRRARQGQIPEFTGISAPYEEPLAPALRLETAQQSVEASVETLLAYVEQAFRLEPAMTAQTASLR